MNRNLQRLMVAVLIVVIGVGAYGLFSPGEALAKKPGGGGGGRCGKCPCEEVLELDGLTCWLESCHLLYPYPDCLWDCHYVCPFPF